MYTATSKQILSPLAEAISSLIVLISDAEIHKTPIPDLTLLARAVDSQIKNLVQVAARSVNGGDERLRLEMPHGCEEVTKASDLLLTSVAQLVKDPYSTYARLNLLTSTKGILKGTTLILSTFDDFEVRKIVALSSKTRNRLAAVEGVDVSKTKPAKEWEPPITDEDTVRDPRSVEHFIHAVALSAQSVFHLAQLTTSRIQELLNPTLQRRLGFLVGVLVRESPMLVSGCKVLLANPDLNEAKEVRRECCRRLVGVCREIEVVVQYCTDEEAMKLENEGQPTKQVKRLQDTLPPLRQALLHPSNNPTDLKKALADYTLSSTSHLSSIQSTLPHLTSPQSKQDIQSLLDSLKSLQTRLSTLAASALETNAKPHHPDLQTHLDLLQSKHQLLQAGRNRALAGDLCVLTSQLSDRRNVGGGGYGGLWEVAQRGNRAGLAQAVAGFEAEAGRLISLTGLAGEVVRGEGGDAETAKDVEGLRDRLARLRPGVGAAAAVVCVNPGDGASKEYLGKVAEAWEEGVKELRGVLVEQEGAFKLPELISGLRYAFTHHADALQKSLASLDQPLAHSHTLSLLSTSTHLLSLAKRELESTPPDEPAYRSALETRIRDLEKVFPNLQAKLKKMHDLGPGRMGEVDVGLLQGYVGDLFGRWVSLGDVMRARRGLVPEGERLEGGGGAGGAGAGGSLASGGVEGVLGGTVMTLPGSTDLEVQGISVQVLEHAMADVVIVEEEPPVLLPEAEAKANPIQAAAQELKVEASHWTSDGNPIIEAANLISEYLSELSNHHNLLKTNPLPETKKSFIKSAQNISLEASRLVSYATPLMERCTDKRLKTQLKGSLDRLTTLGQQLKILAAVKTSAPGDTDQDALLVACARNLMQESKEFTFDDIFDSTASQETVFDRLGMELIEHAFEGYNVSLFAYGQTGSGKSYTMMGDHSVHAQKGIIPRSMESIFHRIHQMDPSKRSCELTVSYVEIYNEKVRDLLIPPPPKTHPHPPPPPQNLKVREHPTLGTYVEDALKLVVVDVDQVKHLLELGDRNRTVGATLMNEGSSRSHAVFTVYLKQTISLDDDDDEDNGDATGDEKKPVTEQKGRMELWSRMCLVDLAGSERADATGAKGKRLMEGAKINRSLTTLGKVISALAEASTAAEPLLNRKTSTRSMKTPSPTKDIQGASTAPPAASTPSAKEPHIPYRDSTLTYLLRDTLGGNSKTLMLSTISPSASHLDETLSTLRFAERAKKIKCQAVVNGGVVGGVEGELRAEVKRLKALLEMYEKGQLDVRNQQQPSSGVEEESGSKMGEEERKELESLREQLKTSEKLVKEISATLAERLQKTEAVAHWEDSIPSSHHPSHDQITSPLSAASPLPTPTAPPPPQLLNLSTKPESEPLIHPLLPGLHTVGSLRDASIPLHPSPGVELTHAYVESVYTDSEGWVCTLFPTPGARTVVGGAQVECPVVLESGCRIVFGDRSEKSGAGRTWRFVVGGGGGSVGGSLRGSVRSSVDVGRVGTPETPGASVWGETFWRPDAGAGAVNSHQHPPPLASNPFPTADGHRPGTSMSVHTNISDLTHRTSWSSTSDFESTLSPRSVAPYHYQQQQHQQHQPQGEYKPPRNNAWNTSQYISLQDEVYAPPTPQPSDPRSPPTSWSPAPQNTTWTPPPHLHPPASTSGGSTSSRSRHASVSPPLSEHAKLLALGTLHTWRKRKYVRLASEILFHHRLLKEANVIARELGKDVLYDFVILDPTADLSTLHSFWESPSTFPLTDSSAGLLGPERPQEPYVGIRVLDGRHESVYYWTLKEFVGRLPAMRTLYTIPESASGFYEIQRVQQTESAFYEGEEAPPKGPGSGGLRSPLGAPGARRPYFDCIGLASVGVRGLGMGVSAEISTPVVDVLTGETRGTLRVVVSPISVSEGIHRRSDDGKELGYLEDGTVVVFEVSVLEMAGMDEENWTQVHAQFRLEGFGVSEAADAEGFENNDRADVFSDAYSLLGAKKSGLSLGGSGNSKVYSTDPASGFGKGPIRWEFSQTLSVVVTSRVREVLERGLVRFEVYGRRQGSVQSLIDGLYKSSSPLKSMPPKIGGGDSWKGGVKLGGLVSPREAQLSSSGNLGVVGGGNDRAADKDRISTHVILAHVQLLELSSATGEFKYVPVQSTSPTVTTSSPSSSANLLGGTTIHHRPDGESVGAAPDTFLIRQGLQRRILISLSHVSGRGGLPWRRLTYLRIGQIRLVNARTNLPIADDIEDLSTRTATKAFVDLPLPGLNPSEEGGPLTPLTASQYSHLSPHNNNNNNNQTYQQSKETNRPWFSRNGKTVLEVQLPWDSSLHGSIHLNRPTKRGCRVEMTIAWGVEVDPLGAPTTSSLSSDLANAGPDGTHFHGSTSSLDSLSSSILSSPGPSNWLVFGSPMHFETTVGVIVHDRDFKVKASTKLLELGSVLGMGMLTNNAKYAQKLCAVFETRVLKSSSSSGVGMTQQDKSLSSLNVSELKIDSSLVSSVGGSTSTRKRNWAALKPLQCYSRERRMWLDEVELTKQRIEEMYMSGIGKQGGAVEGKSEREQMGRLGRCLEIWRRSRAGRDPRLDRLLYDPPLTIDTSTDEEPVQWVVAETHLLPKSASPISLKGYLLTPSNTPHTASSSNSPSDDTWIKSYFVVRRPWLYIYPSSSEMEETSVYSLSNVGVYYGPDLLPQREHVFALLSRDTTLLMQAGSEEEMNEWISALDPLQHAARLSKLNVN
ncbi:kinesin-like protein Klp8 [Chytridiales sp. JEL 0842]|nr:kinesin-like protein Klp8 [Chytridiales sp. JEL 0842]